MPRKKVELEHPMAGKSRASKTQELMEGSQDIFDKLDEKKATQAAEAEEARKPVAPQKLRSLKELLFVGTLSKTVSVDGFVFKLRSLTHQESRAVAKRIFRLSDSDKLIESNAIQLAYSLESINGLDIDEAFAELFEETEELSTIDKSLKIVSSLNNHLTAKLIDEYFELSKESKGLLNPEESNDLKK